MDFTKKIPYLVCLIAFIVLNDSFKINGLRMKYEKWGEYWLKHNENWVKELSFMPFWTKVIFLLASHLYYSFQSISNVFSNPIYCTQYYLELSCTSRGLKTYVCHPSHKGLTINLLITTLKTPFFHCNLIYFIVAYFPFVYCILFNHFHWFNAEVILNCSSYVYHLSTQSLSKLQWFKWVSISDFTYLQLYLWNKVEA